MEYQKHYRLPTVHLLDSNRTFERRHHRGGWPFFMLVDKKGQVVYKKGGSVEKEMPEIAKILGDMLGDSPAVQAVKMEGVWYVPATLRRSGEGRAARRRDRFTSLACSSDGKIYVVFTTNRNGNSDVFIRIFDGADWSGDKPIAATAADEFDGTVTVDEQNRVWVGWTSNAGSGNYNIFVTTFTELPESVKPVQLTQADDDAMRARMACDSKGRVWMTYYRWHKIGQRSRDKEVYVRCCEGGKWSEEVRVSPTDVSEYEDHSDPAIAGYGDGVIVGWSWDYHRPKGYTKAAKEPTIFIRKVSSDFALGKPVAVSGKQIDVTPAIDVGADKRIWCAWDSLGSGRKALYVKSVNVTGRGKGAEAFNLSGPVVNVCTPSLTTGQDNAVVLLWSETSDGKRWVLKMAGFAPKLNLWSNVKTIESKNDPRFCSADYDRNGDLWLSYSAQTNQGREIVVRKLGKKELGALSYENVQTAEAPGTAGNLAAIEKLRRAVDEKYSYRDLRGVDWESLFVRYSPAMERARSPRRFAEAAARLLAHARDKHIWVKIGNESIGGFKRYPKPNYNLEILQGIVPRWRDLNDRVSTGRFEDGIGYIMIRSWSRQRSENLEAAFEALRHFADAPGLIIDVRPNSGGAEPLAQKFAGCFVENPVVYAKHVNRDASRPGGFGEIQERVLRPNKDRPNYGGRITVLMGQANMSSCEAFLLMMKQVPGCKLVGATSYGSSGNPKPTELGNGVTVWLPSWKALRPDGTCFEGEGIKPDVLVRTTKAQLRKRDRVLEAALKLLRRP